ncbi:MAG: lamin tail domain-containing protein [Chlorobi bacterium]|nr:lamin tail domain-containing protein [Chlorobiota bacterium]
MGPRAAIGLLATVALPAQVVINEMQPVPPTGEPEWVELYNPADTDAVLTNIYLYDRTARASLAGVIVPARGFAVLTRDTDDLKLLRRIPPIARLYQVSLPTLNNTTESLFLATRDTVVLDSVYYDMRWGIRGRTLERVDPARPGYLRDNITACIAPDSATCGYDNSVSMVERDVQLRGVRVDSLLTAHIEAANRGRTPMSGVTVRLRYRRPRQDEWFQLGQIIVEYLPPAATSQVSIALSDYSAITSAGYGNFQLQAIADVADQRSWNDTVTTPFFIPFPRGSIVINEIMYDPLDGRSEYVELSNTTDDTLDVSGLVLGDAFPPQVVLPSVLLPPSGLAVVALDTGIWAIFPELRSDHRCIMLKTSWSLNNSGDALILANPNHSVLDSLRYYASWHFWGIKDTKGRSLEKLRPNAPSNDARSWTTSTDPRGGTPGTANSILPRDTAQVVISATPNPFSPVSTDPRLQQTTITYRLPWQSARVTLRIFDPIGIPIRQLANGLYSGADGALLWDGRNDAGFAVGAGVYVLLLEATNASSSDTIHATAAIVVGK